MPDSEIMWVFTVGDDPVFCSTEEEVLNKILEKLGNESEDCDVTPIRVIDSPPEDFFCSVTLDLDNCDILDINYWFEDSPYEDAYVIVDEDCLEVGAYVRSVEEALALAESQWKRRSPDGNGKWELGEFKLTE